MIKIYKNINFITTLILCFSTYITSYASSFSVPDIFSDGMVLQQNTNVNLWGFAKPKTRITLEAEWLEQPLTETANNDSLFFFEIPTPEASFDQYTLALYNADDTLFINNILIGEVWFASGQSNMEMPLNGFWNCPINDNNEAIATASEWGDEIRFVTIPKTGATTPQKTVGGKWQVPSPKTAPWISATAWYFAQMVSRVLDCPVGVIVCAWGGSRVEGWTPKQTLLKYDDVNLEKELKEGWNGRWWECYTPLVMYNGMFKPVCKYTYRGFLWYQGEANVGKDSYFGRLTEMVRQWREDAGKTAEQLPFFLTEIAPWEGYGEWLSAPLLREQQHLAGHTIPNAGCICTNDLVKPFERANIHPAEKKQVGYRLAYMALNRTYGLTDIHCDSPEYLRHEVHGSEIEVFFTNAEDGLTPYTDITGFEIAAEDGVFHPAEAVLNEQNKSIIVRSEEVEFPVSVRYCFKAFQLGNVRSSRNLPLVPFRTDKN